MLMDMTLQAAKMPEKSAMGSRNAEEAGKPAGGLGTAGERVGGTAGAASSGSWGWGKGWLPTAALQQVAAGELAVCRVITNSCEDGSCGVYS